MSSIGLDLHAYLERIRWQGAVRPDRSSLAALLHAHMMNIPFENLDVLLARPVRLDIASVQDKLVGARRGGYCFEQATLFAAALESLGFAPVRHSARVVRFVPRTQAPRTHMFLTVPVEEGLFVVDPGLGGFAPRVPVPLLDGVAARAGDEVHWMVREGAHWILRTQMADAAVDLWVSTIEADNLVDFEMGNHFVATHPQSIFRNRLMLRALTPDGRVTVMNREVTIWRGPRAQAAHLADRAELRELLRQHFGFDLPDVARLQVPEIPQWA